MPDSSRDEAFLSRWSRLKRQRETASATPTAAPGATALHDEAPGEAPAPAPVLTDADMPPVESLGETSDFSGFLSAGVSQELRDMALRKLFSLPQFNVVDGLNDYDEDYTKLAPLGDTVTYQMRQWLERDAKTAAAAHDDSTGARGDASPAAQEHADAESTPMSEDTQTGLQSAADSVQQGSSQSD